MPAAASYGFHGRVDSVLDAAQVSSENLELNLSEPISAAQPSQCRALPVLAGTVRVGRNQGRCDTAGPTGGPVQPGWQPLLDYET